MRAEILDRVFTMGYGVFVGEEEGERGRGRVGVAVGVMPVWWWTMRLLLGGSVRGRRVRARAVGMAEGSGGILLRWEQGKGEHVGRGSVDESMMEVAEEE